MALQPLAPRLVELGELGGNDDDGRGALHPATMPGPDAMVSFR